MANNVTFDLELAISGFNNNLKSVDKNLTNFHNDFQNRAKTSNASWSSFVGNLSANAVSFAIKSLGNLVDGMASFTKESIIAAVNAQETASKFEAVFSTISGESAKAAKDLQKNFGLGVTESRALLSATGDLLTGFGFTQEGALKLSTDVQKLAVDLSSFTNFSGGATGASEALTKALLGERESLKALGVSISEKAVQDQVAINNARGVRFETEQQAKAQATLDLVTRQSTNAIGDYAKTSGGAANQLKLFNTKMEDLSIAFGENFLPILEPVIGLVNEFISSLSIESINEFVQTGLAGIINGFAVLVDYINPVIQSIKNIGSIFNILQNGITSGLSTIGIALTAAAQGWIIIFQQMLAALPQSIVPEGWIEALEESKLALNESMAGLVESVSTDSDDMAASLNNIVDPTQIISDESIENIKLRLNTVKTNVLASRTAIDSDEDKRKKLKAANQKKQDVLDKKRQDDINQELIKQTEFEEELYGKRLTWEETGGKERAQNLKSTLGTMATLSKSGNSTLAAIGKASAISIATIDGFQAVQKALASAPPPFNFALAGVVGVATAANIAGIAGVKFEKGGIVPGASFTGDSIQARVNSGEMILNRGQQSELFSQLNNGGTSSNTSLILAINSLGDRIANMEIIIQADDKAIARSVSRGVESGIIIGRT